MVFSSVTFDEVEAALRRVPPDRLADVLLFVEFLEYQASKEAQDDASEDHALWAAGEANQAYKAQHPGEMELHESGADFLAVTPTSEAIPPAKERGAGLEKTLVEPSTKELEALIERTIDRRLNVWLTQLTDALLSSQEEETVELRSEFAASLRHSLTQALSGEGIDLKTFRDQIAR